jgi:hypothetical protein
MITSEKRVCEECKFTNDTLDLLVTVDGIESVLVICFECIQKQFNIEAKAYAFIEVKRRYYVLYYIITTLNS